jgi:hypothetical protein
LGCAEELVLCSAEELVLCSAEGKELLDEINLSVGIWVVVEPTFESR